MTLSSRKYYQFILELKNRKSSPKAGFFKPNTLSILVQTLIL
ncbi:hypothetical protein GAGA_4126 [Paraglaciecola agarilytica NO2]|uniref:Uncharacterized protein n=1 Tax=Paraglaciecola agarilytica NO2 TaxID=1125747 RepID=A0ABQ0ICE9_9ALTE|nr:hypothetical protein GAGA_4126 [Paraglaciecola agarilytica NO2]